MSGLNDLLRAINAMPRRREHGSGRNAPVEPEALIPQRLRGYPPGALGADKQNLATIHNEESDDDDVAT